MELYKWLGQKRKDIKQGLTIIALIILGLLAYHFFVLIPFERRRDEAKYQACINNVHASFENQWGPGGVDTERAIKLEEWRSKNNEICNTALSLPLKPNPKQ